MIASSLVASASRSVRTPPLLGISVVRNEADIVGETLRHAAAHHDGILVVDAGSTDGTVAEIRGAAEECPAVVFLGSLDEPVWAEKVRRHVWALFRDRVPPGTWWSVVDADEFAEEDVRVCAAAADAEGADYIQGGIASFHYLESEARAWREGRETVADRRRPIEERRRFYDMGGFSVRLFRQSELLRWNEDTMNPKGLVRVWSRRIHYRHYQHRDLDQLAVRLATRASLDLPEDFRKVHFHWEYDLNRAITPDGSPGLREHRPGAPLIPDADLLPPRVRGPLARLVARHKARRRARKHPQEPPALLLETPVDEILERIFAR